MARYLKRNHGTEAPSNLIFVDTESFKVNRSDVVKKTALKLRLWCATRVRLEKGKVTRRKEADGLTSDSFWQFVSENSDSQRRTWIFAHNLNHDLTQLRFWHELDAGRFVTTPMKSKRHGTDGQSKSSWTGKLCVESSPFWLVVRDGSKTYTMVDTFNYWQCSLAMLGESVGIPKVECDTDRADLIELMAYCKNDVAIIEASVCNLIKMWTAEDCGVFKPTAASLAMTNFQHTCDIRTPDGKSVDIVTDPGSKRNVLERESYFGGRIQSFFVGEVHSPVYHLDCNSLYPYVMREHSYPRRHVTTRRNISVEELRSACEVYAVVARVDIVSRYETFPVRLGGKQFHCTGRFNTTLSGLELKRGISSGCIRAVPKVQFYSKAPLFRSWVNNWFDRKVAYDRLGCSGIAGRMFCKLILNSLSGKWAQHGRTWKDVPARRSLARWGGYCEYDRKSGRVLKKRGIAGNEQILCDSGEPDHAFPLISACITSNAREYMRSVINMCPDRSVYYMATDSIICNADAYERLRSEGYIHPTELGKFKVSGVHRYACFHGPNDYVLDSKQVLSGHAGKMQVDETGKYTVELWDRASTVVARGPTDEILITESPTFYPDHPIRGAIGEDGWWIPYRIQDDVYFTDRPRQGSHFSRDLPDMEAARTLPIG